MSLNESNEAPIAIITEEDEIVGQLESGEHSLDHRNKSVIDADENPVEIHQSKSRLIPDLSELLDPSYLTSCTLHVLLSRYHAQKSHPCPLACQD